MFSDAGATIYTTSFNLDLPTPEYAVPLAFQFQNSTSAAGPGNWRAVLYVNGRQYAKYVNNIGPQTNYPVPEGILNYQGENKLGLILWGFDDGGVQLGQDGLELVMSEPPVLTGRGEVWESVGREKWCLLMLWCFGGYDLGGRWRW